MSVSSILDDTPIDPDDELLSSYLDGELSREEEVNLENRLVQNEGLRERLKVLQTGWDLLDDLPDSAPSLNLVESTLELAVADIEQSAPSKSWSFSGLKWPLLILGFLWLVLAVPMDFPEPGNSTDTRMSCRILPSRKILTLT